MLTYFDPPFHALSQIQPTLPSMTSQTLSVMQENNQKTIIRIKGKHQEKLGENKEQSLRMLFTENMGKKDRYYFRHVCVISRFSTLSLPSTDVTNCHNLYTPPSPFKRDTIIEWPLCRIYCEFIYHTDYQNQNHNLKSEFCDLEIRIL